VSASTVTLVIPAKTEYLILARLALAGIAREVRIDETALADLKLAVTEACGNAIRHAHPSGQGVVSVRYDVEPGSIEIRVEDEGPGITSGAVPPEPTDELSEGGMGLAIIDALVDELEIGARAGAQGTLVLMRKRLLPA
jgi:serine/threonine-protein kinase RsbW